MITRQDSSPIAENADGCYCTFDIQNQGALFQIWSKQAVADAIMYFKPSKAPPAFKYNQGGKTELIRNIQSDHKKYFQGFCAFIKACKKDGGELTLISCNESVKPIGVYLHNKDNTVSRMEIGKGYAIDNCDAAACIPMDNRSLETKTLTTTLFKEKGEANGAYIGF